VSEEPIRMTRPLAWLWLGGVAVVGALAGLAALSLAGTLNSLVSNFPGAIGASGWLIAGGYVTLAVGGLWVILRLPPRWALVGGLALLVLVRVVAMFVVDPPLVRDPAGYNRLALGVLEGECCFGYFRPMGYPVLLAGAYAVGLSGKVVTLAAALIGGPLIWALGNRLGGRRSGAVALYLYAIWPAGALLTGVLLTEPLYGTLVLAALWLSHGAAGRLGSAGHGAGGFVLGLSHYVRATGVVLAPAFLLPLLLRRAWLQAVLLVLLMLIPLLPLVAATGGISTSPLAGWTVLVGTNREHDGHYNDDDVALYASWGPDGERLAREEAVRRIVQQPGGFATLAVRKASAMWASEGYSVFFAFFETGVPQRVREAIRLSAQLFYVPVFLAAAVGLWRMRRGPPDVAIVIVGIIVTLAAMHTFVEVQGRYHHYAVPLLILLAASLAGNARWAGWRSRESDGAGAA
jgi:hypothetical protein